MNMAYRWIEYGNDKVHMFLDIRILDNWPRILLGLLYNPRDKYRVQHRVIVVNGLPIGWFKCNKGHLAKTMGSLGWFVCGFQFDPSLHVVMIVDVIIMTPADKNVNLSSTDTNYLWQIQLVVWLQDWVSRSRFHFTKLTMFLSALSANNIIGKFISYVSFPSCLSCLFYR